MNVKLEYTIYLIGQIINISVWVFGILGFFGLGYLIYKRWIAKKIKDGMK